MVRNLVILGCFLAVFCMVFFPAPSVLALPDTPHAAFSCTDCHATQPVAGRPVDFVFGDKTSICSQCHTQFTAPPSLIMAPAAAATTVRKHSSAGMIPEAMKQGMIQWLASNGYPAWDDPAVPWSYGCTTCHTMHGAPFPMLLNYPMEQGELCVLCHGGTVNSAADWTQTTARRVLYGPAHLGLLQADGVTEAPVPAFPQNNDVVSNTVNFPLAVFAGFHRFPADIAYRISIPNSVFGVKEVNPANHLSWYISDDMVTWDTTQEADGPYTVSIIPFNPATMVSADPVSFTVFVQNMTLADNVCALVDKIRQAGIQNHCLENSLIAKATLACKAAQKEQWNVAAGILRALNKEIKARKGKHIPEASALALIEYVDSLLAQFPKQDRCRGS